MEKSISNYDEEQFIKENGILDLDTPLHQELKGIYKRSFAYYTLRQRLPQTLTNLLATLKSKEERTDVDSADWKFIEDSILQLRHQLNTNAHLELFNGDEADKDVWNEFIRKLPKEMSTYYSTTWLFAECHIYRKLASFFQATKSLQLYDYFREQKLNNLLLASSEMEHLAQFMQNTKTDLNTFEDLLKLCLWSNRCDLSITSGKAVQPNENVLQSLQNLNNNILVDQTAAIWKHLTANNRHDDAGGKERLRIDFVCDNAAFELFTDLLLAQYLIEHQFAQIVRFHIKAIPWFISDTTINDIHDLLNYLEKHSNSLLKALGSLWQNYINEGKFQIAPLEHFWTSPYEFYRMAEIQPLLYKELEKSFLIIFKGDLNYRKLLGDYNWNSTDDFSTALRGFHPSNLCTLRTVKGDLICGLPDGLAEQLTKNQTNWMFTGQYAVIQYAPLPPIQK